MNRDKFISEEKQIKPHKPSFVPTGVMLRGDKVVNVEIIYTPEGHYEIGCEWMVTSYDDNKNMIWVSRIIDNGVENKQQCFNCCFQIVEKGWIDKKHPTNLNSFYSSL